jgi:hypothetical protein
MTELKRGLITLWFYHQRDAADADYLAARIECDHLDASAEAARFRVQLVSGDPRLEMLANAAFAAAGALSGSPGRNELRERENRFEAAVMTFIQAASGRLRAPETEPAKMPETGESKQDGGSYLLKAGFSQADLRLRVITFADNVAAGVVTVLVIAGAIVLARAVAVKSSSTSTNIIFGVAAAPLVITFIWLLIVPMVRTLITYFRAHDMSNVSDFDKNFTKEIFPQIRRGRYVFSIIGMFYGLAFFSYLFLGVAAQIK